MNSALIPALAAGVLTLLQIAALYFVFSSSGVLKGKLASSFYKIGIGVLLSVISVSFLGWGWGFFDMSPTNLLYQVIALGLNFASALFLIFGFKHLRDILRELRK